jgi:Rieske 2Fe-2S family protein
MRKDGPPVAVGRVEDLAEPGCFLTFEAGDVPILVTRDQGGTIHAMLNLCRHRGMQLVYQRRGQATSFVCPHHGWTYDVCGRLDRPMGDPPLSRCSPSDMREDHALVALPLEIRDGVVWVTPTAVAQDLARYGRP